MIVEDEAGVREVYGLLLELEGFEVELSPDGLDALERVARDDFDLVLTDLMMPRVDGLELLQRMQQQPNRPPTILLTAVPPALFQATADAVLTKPVEITVLVATIRGLLAASPAR